MLVLLASCDGSSQERNGVNPAGRGTGGADFEKHERFVDVFLAIQSKDYAGLDKLVSEGEPVSSTIDGMTPLMVATSHGDAKALSVILGKKPDVDARDFEGLTALHHAARCWNSEMVIMLAEAGASVDAVSKNGDVPLHFWLEDGHPDSTQESEDDRRALLLLSNAKTTNAMNSGRRTPLEFATAGELELMAARETE